MAYEFGRSNNDEEISSIRATDKEIETHLKHLEVISQSQTKHLVMLEKDVQLLAMEEKKHETQLALGLNHAQEEISTLFKLSLRSIDYFRFR